MFLGSLFRFAPSQFDFEARDELEVARGRIIARRRWMLRPGHAPIHREMDGVLEVDGHEHAVIVLRHPRPVRQLERTLVELCGVYPRVICSCSKPVRSLVEGVSQELHLNNLLVLDVPSVVGKG
jgi:hypothetical protein